MENIQSSGAAFRLIFSCLVVAVLLSCSKSEPATITIKGNLPNLPPGSVVLKMLDSDGWKTIDSVVAKGGIFEFNLPVAQYPEPVLVEISHYDTAGIKRPIISSTGTKGKAGYGGIEATTGFLLEDGIGLMGPVEVQDMGWYKTIHMKQSAHVGRQSRVMYDDTAGFRVTPNLNKLIGLIKQHPYSYYYFENVGTRAAKLSNAQFCKLFNAFDKDVRESKTGREMKDYVDTRSKYKLTAASVFPDQNGKPQTILDERAKLNLVILWASWCGPCRREIPHLTKIQERFGGTDNFQMASISMDEDSEAWTRQWSMKRCRGSNCSLPPKPGSTPMNYLAMATLFHSLFS